VNNQAEWIGFDWIDLYYEPTETSGPRVPFRDFPDVTVPPAPNPLTEHTPTDSDPDSYFYCIGYGNINHRWGAYKNYYKDTGKLAEEGTVIFDADTGREYNIGYTRGYYPDGSLSLVTYSDANGLGRFTDRYDNQGNFIERWDFSSESDPSNPAHGKKVRIWDYNNGKLDRYEEYDASGMPSLTETYDNSGKLIASQKY
jgi:hypothetical protein